MTSCVFGEHTVSGETLLQSFFNYIPLDERQIVKKSLIKKILVSMAMIPNY